MHDYSIRSIWYVHNVLFRQNKNYKKKNNKHEWQFYPTNTKLKVHNDTLLFVAHIHCIIRNIYIHMKNTWKCQNKQLIKHRILLIMQTYLRMNDENSLRPTFKQNNEFKNHQHIGDHFWLREWIYFVCWIKNVQMLWCFVNERIC